jgi:hypothetical protein
MTLGATLLWKKNHAIRDAFASCRLFLSDFLPVLSRCWAPCIYCCDSMGVGVRAKTQLSAMGEEVVQSVQALAPSLAALPPEFVRPDQEQTGSTTFGGPAAPGARLRRAHRGGSAGVGALPGGQPRRARVGGGGAAARGAGLLRAAAGGEGAARHGPGLRKDRGVRHQAAARPLREEDVERLLLPRGGAAGDGQPRRLARAPRGVQGGQRGVLPPPAAPHEGSVRAPLRWAGTREGRLNWRRRSAAMTSCSCRRSTSTRRARSRSSRWASRRTPT